MNDLLQVLKAPELRGALRAAVIFIIGLAVAGIVSRRLKLSRLDVQTSGLVRQILRYGIVVAAVVLSMKELGIDLGVLLGAAGILTVAIGFASQTSASNLISGLFLMGERPFVVGDVIRISDVTGEVLSIGSLSVRLRTFDNLSVRIPNETVLKSNLTNLTRFPIRRFDLAVGVAYDSDLELVRKVALEVADKNPICLEEPKPDLLFQGFGDSSINYTLQIWATRENFLELRNTTARQLKDAFDRSGITIPFPQRTVHLPSGAAGQPRPQSQQQTDHP